MARTVVLAIMAMTVIASLARAGQNPQPSALDSAAPARRAFHELNLAGEPNAVGFAVVGVRKGPTPYRLEVTGGAVAAHPRTTGAPVLTGAEPVGHRPRSAGCGR
jgi:hypothetical protein